MTPRLRRFGYCEGKAIEKTVISKEGDCIRGHEFHHSIFKSDEKCAYKMRKIRDGKFVDEWEGGYSKKNTLATYLHTHFYNNLDCIENILKNCYKMRKIRDGKFVDEWEGGYSKKNTLATYLHTHFYNNLDCIENILKNCER